jgi:hypothetical protein
MADIASAQRVRIWDGTNNFGVASTDPLYVRIHDTNNELNPAVYDAPALGTEGGAVLMVQRNDGGGNLVSLDGDWSPLQVDATGNLRVTVTGGGGNSSVKADDATFTVAVDEVTPMGAMYDDTAPPLLTTERDVGIPRMTQDRKLLVRIVGGDDATDRLEVTSAGAAHVNIAQVLGATHSETNPLFVQVVDEAASGNEVHDYNTAASIAAGAPSNHDYAAVGTFFLKSIIVAASGAMKCEIQTGAAGGPTTRAVIFTTGSQLTKQVNFAPPLEVAAVDIVRIIRQNDENQAQDLYSTIIGFDV